VNTVVLGVSGSIAAYKAADIANELTKDGVAVHVIMTEAARKFIAPLTFQTLTKHKVYTDMFEEIFYEDVRHISLAKSADAVLIAPATANTIARIAVGIACDYLSTVTLAARGTLLIAPAMNTAMWEHPATQENIAKLKTRGAVVIEPQEARLACGDLGKGAMAGKDIIINTLRQTLDRKREK
jgi:phosphopantothenoylcysteine decarboxylase/phosphopantothenoylcysteine decarboxylase/phosphopantothenate--cysteine ligase